MTSGNDIGCRNAKERMAKLKTEEMVIARNCRASINAIRMCDQRLANDINIVTRELEEARKHEKMKTSKDIADIYEELAAVQNAIHRDESLLDFSPKSCKEKLMQLQSRILQTRDYLEKEIFILKNEEKTIFEEVLLAQQRIEDGSKYESPPTNQYKFVNAKVTKQIRNFHTAKDEDIENFEKFVELHSHTGGWEEQDHLLFFRAKRKVNKDLKKLYSTLTNQLPDMTSEKITQHLQWFEEYERLREKSKLAIQRWKESKLKEKERARRGSKERKNSGSSVETAESEQTKQQIALWKKQREQERGEQEQKLKEEKEAERLRQKAEREKQKTVREQMIILKQERQRSEQSAKAEQKLMEAEIRRERAEEARKMIKTYRKLDDLHVEKLKLMRITRQERREPPKIMTDSRVSAPRNPDRLLQMTQVWRAKCKIDEMENRSKFPQPTLHVRNIPHLKVPDWRKGMT